MNASYVPLLFGNAHVDSCCVALLKYRGHTVFDTIMYHTRQKVLDQENGAHEWMVASNHGMIQHLLHTFSTKDKSADTAIPVFSMLCVVSTISPGNIFTYPFTIYFYFLISYISQTKRV